jgi:hypothetical protein
MIRRLISFLGNSTDDKCNNLSGFLSVTMQALRLCRLMYNDEFLWGKMLRPLQSSSLILFG